jgi:hypothetical protein
MCGIPPRQCCQSPNGCHPIIAVSIHFTLEYKIPQKNENGYIEMFISILARLFPINLGIIFYSVTIIETIK